MMSEPGPLHRLRLLVLPFGLLTPDRDIEFLAFSLPDAVAATLSSLHSIVVRSGRAPGRFSADPPDLHAIAQQAGADAVVSGALIRAGNEVRLSYQLARAEPGTPTSSYSERAPADDLIRLQRALVERIVYLLALPLTARDWQQLRHGLPASPRAFDCYLRANRAIQDADAWGIARDLYQKSIDEDPEFAPAWTGLARVHRLFGKYRRHDAERNLGRAEAALQRALMLNPDLPMAQNLYAQIEVDSGRAQAAMVRLLERAADRGGHADVFAGLVQACRFCGLLEASLAADRRARQLDAAIVTGVMHTSFVMRRYADVIASPGVIEGYVYLLALDALGRRDDAIAVLARLSRDGHRTPELLESVGDLIVGNRDGSLAALDAAVHVLTDPEGLYYVARHYAHLGEAGAALETLARAIAGGYYCDDGLAHDRWFDPVRDDPAFHALHERARAGRAAALEAFNRAGGPKVLVEIAD